MAAIDKASRRQELLRAARDVFATKGFHDAKVDDICAVAGIAKGTFYLYFPDKRSVFAELVDSLFARLGQAIHTVDTKGDVAEEVKANIRAVIGVLVEDPKLTQILMSFAVGLDPEFSAKIDSFYEGSKAMMTESLRFGQRLGIVAEGDARIWAVCTIGALKELLFENATSATPRPREEIVEAIFAFLERGYLRIPGRRDDGG